MKTENNFRLCRDEALLIATGTAANRVTAIHAVENGTSDTTNRCAKFHQISRGVAWSANRNR
jgi:hypothetical protein